MKEVVYLQSLIYNELGKVQERDQKVKEFHQLRKNIFFNQHKNSYNEI